MPPEKRWYEDEQELNSLVPQSVDCVVQWNRENIMQTTEADLNPQQPTNAPLIDDTTHEGFIAEARTRRLARKCRRQWQIRSSDSSSKEDIDKTTCVDSENDICPETSKAQGITPANEEIESPSETSG